VNSLATKSAAGRDHVAEQGVVNKSSNNRSLDQSRIARSNAEYDRPEADGADRERKKTDQRSRDGQKSVKLRPPQERGRGR
jgi:hypothetical protein